MASSNGSRSSSGTRSRSGSNQSRSRSNTNTRSNSKSTSRQASAYNRNKTTEPMDIAIRNEILFIAAIAVCICLFLCNILNFGAVGAAVSGFMFGTVGLIAYVIPIVIFLAVAFGISNVGNNIATRKLVAALCVCLLFMVFCELFSADFTDDSGFAIKEVYERCKEAKNGGGILGGAIAFCLVHFLGKIGTILLSIVGLVICFIVLTDKSFIQGVSKHGKKVYERSREDAEYRRERLEEKRRRQEEERQEYERQKEERASRMKEMKLEKQEAKENEKILRMDKHVTGVMIDTALSKESEPVKTEKERDDLHEIMLDVNGLPQEPDIPVAVTEKKFTGYEHMVDATNAKHGIHAISLPDVSSQEELTTPQPTKVNPIHATQESKAEVIKDEVIDEVTVDTATVQSEPGPIIHKDGKQYGVDPGLYGEGAVNKPQDSYSTQIGNSMAIDPNKKRVSASLKPSEEPIHTGMVSGATQGEAGKTVSTNAAAVSEPTVAPKPPKKYIFPSTELLHPLKKKAGGDSERELRETAARLQQTLASFGVKATITDISQGPSVTRYELQPEQGVKVSKIVGLADDIKLNLAATDIRIEAPIPGKAAVGIEVPNKENSAVSLRELLEAKEYKDFKANLTFAVGKDIGGQVVVTDIAKMPHMLIAGSTGSGKSVCINTIIMSILFKAHPDDVKLIMVDPKVVELSVYNHIPHLLIPVVTDPKKASSALHWGVVEMTERYKKFADYNVRDLKGFNEKVERMLENNEPGAPDKMPQIVIIVDELADLMMVCPGEVEESICRLAQLARAAGIHLIIATQRPSVDVITGLIKANMPSRVAFAVSSGVDSRTILDMNGAEKLLGKGDMLFYPQGYPKPARIQGAFVSDDEVSAVVDFINKQGYVSGNGENIDEIVNSMSAQSSAGGSQGTNGAADDSGSDLDQYFEEAGKFIIEKDKASIGMLQRVFKIGFNRAARIMDQLCEAGVVGEEEGTKPRKILMTMAQFEELMGGSNEE